MPAPVSTFCSAHHAMATRFEIRIRHPDQRYASQFASEAFGEIDALENLFSRYIEHSEISRFNRWPPGIPFSVSEPVFMCIECAESVRTHTDGVFDICCALGLPTASPARPRIFMDPLSQTITRSDASVRIDLGGIGKGFALERIGKLAEEWDITDWIVHGGFSSVLARGSSDETHCGWPVRLSGNTARTIQLINQAVGASGTDEKGDHIVDPRSGKARVINPRVWVVGPNAATADALSTAFMLLDEASVRRTLDCYSGYECIVDSNASLEGTGSIAQNPRN